MLNYSRYKRVPVVEYSERQWPTKIIEKAPIWCSVDLRDGNQSLIEPMIVEEKVEFFQLLVRLGFKEIEIGFPSASQIEFNFLRKLVEDNLIPDDVTVQVLVQCREHLIERTFEALQGVKKAVVHIYNSTSILQRDVVFHMSKDEITQIAIEGTKLVKKYAESFDGEIILEYSPESFTGTELEYALEICEAVQRTWGATKENPIIINLPATVEMTMANVYADQIEWMCTHFKDRESIIVSVHPHNDRGTGVAATEMAILAGADRVEGTLFGNGERTGNIDILTVAYNMFSQGINPELDLSNINEIIDVYERCCKMQVPMRHPYAGKLVFTAFSGSHQDAINKGVKAMQERKQSWWEVPYLPIDPLDLGREYEPIVRINSQSGKGGIAYIMDSEFGYKLPKGMHREFASVIQKIAEKTGEVAPSTIMQTFNKEYLSGTGKYELCKAQITDIENDMSNVQVYLNYEGAQTEITAIGNGPLDAVIKAMEQAFSIKVQLLDYTQHSLGEGSEAKAAAYIALKSGQKETYGVGISNNITRASIKALFSGINRLF
ncbi:MAG: 2-isopropylmalate synthase [Eubacteriales bacterium]